MFLDPEKKKKKKKALGNISPSKHFKLKVCQTFKLKKMQKTV